MQKSRIAFTVAICASVLFLPWWVSFALIALGVFLFNNFFEAIFLGIFFDGLYASDGIFPGGVVFVSTLFAIVMLVVGNALKKYTRFN